jgi:hypothetical protein
MTLPPTQGPIYRSTNCVLLLHNVCNLIALHVGALTVVGRPTVLLAAILSNSMYLGSGIRLIDTEFDATNVDLFFFHPAEKIYISQLSNWNRPTTKNHAYAYILIELSSLPCIPATEIIILNSSMVTRNH